MDNRLAAALEVLGARGWFAGRSAETRTVLAGLMRPLRFLRGQALYHCGDEPNGMFGLVSGSLDISIPRPDGKDLTAHRTDAGFWVGDLALFSHQTRLVSVRAAEDSDVVHLPAHALRALVRVEPRFYEDFYALTHDNMSTALRLLAGLTVSPSEVRVGLRLLEHAEGAGEGWLNFSQSTLAELVGLSLPTLQRVLQRMQKSGLVELGYGRIRVADRRGLLALCAGTAAR